MTAAAVVVASVTAAVATAATAAATAPTIRDGECITSVVLV